MERRRLIEVQCHRHSGAFAAPLGVPGQLHTGRTPAWQDDDSTTVRSGVGLCKLSWLKRTLTELPRRPEVTTSSVPGCAPSAWANLESSLGGPEVTTSARIRPGLNRERANGMTSCAVSRRSSHQTPAISPRHCAFRLQTGGKGVENIGQELRTSPLGSPETVG